MILCLTCLLVGCGYNTGPITAEMSPSMVEDELARHVYVDMPQRDVEQELYRMKLPFVIRPGDELVAKVLPDGFFYAGADWQEKHPHAELSMTFQEKRLAGASYTHFQPGDRTGQKAELELAEKPEDAP